MTRTRRLGAYAVVALLGVVGGNAWTAWMGELIPGAVRGRFFARRMIYLNVAGTLSTLAAGLALDALTPRGFKGETLGVLAAVACAAGVVSIRFLVAQQSPPQLQEEGAAEWSDAARAVRDSRTRPLLGYLLGWNAAVGISAGFFSFHMLANLEMPFLLVAAHAILVAALDKPRAFPLSYFVARSFIGERLAPASPASVTLVTASRGPDLALRDAGSLVADRHRSGRRRHPLGRSRHRRLRSLDRRLAAARAPVSGFLRVFQVSDSASERPWQTTRCGVRGGM